MEGMLRAARALGIVLLVPLAIVLLLILILTAAAWYYVNTLVYLAKATVRWFKPVPVPSAIPRPHFAELPARKISAD